MPAINLPTWLYNPRLQRRLIKEGKRILVVAAIAASYFAVSAYFHHRHKDNLIEQVGVLERMVEDGNLNGAKSLASSLYGELHDADDARLKALYDDVVF